MAHKRSGTRWYAWSMASLAAMSLVAAPALAAEPALVLAQKAMTAGKPEIALRALNAALSGTELKANDIARAYYFRGLANSKAGNRAAAIADLSQALWLKGLSDAERKQATVAKAALYQQAGLSAPAAPAPVVQAAAPAPADQQAQPESVVEAAASTPDAPSTKSSGWNAKAAAVKQTRVKLAKAARTTSTAATDLPWTGTEEAAQAATPPSNPVPVAAGKVADDPVDSFLGGLFASSADPQPAAADTPAPQAAPIKVASASGAETTAHGGLFLQVASLRTPADAKAFAAKLVAEQGAILGDIKTGVQPVLLGNMGTFYAVRIGPVASAAAGNGLCEQLRGQGVDCFVASP